MQLVYRWMTRLKRIYALDKFGECNMWNKITWNLNDNMNGIQ